MLCLSGVAFVCLKIAFQKGREAVSLVNSERFSVNSDSFKQLMEQT